MTLISNSVRKYCFAPCSEEVVKSGGCSCISRVNDNEDILSEEFQQMLIRMKRDNNINVILDDEKK